MSFDDLIGRAREGDEQAASELVAEFAQHVQNVARSRLTNEALRRRVDEEDVCQSVFAIFFDGLKQGKFELGSPDDAKNLLAQMARTRSLKKIEEHRAAKRDAFRHAELDVVTEPAADQTTASFAAMRHEISDRFRAVLGEEEWQILEARKDGQSWNELARQYKSTPAALRMRHTRAVIKAAKEVGIEPPAVE